jgi:hypothetical protein
MIDTADRLRRICRRSSGWRDIRVCGLFGHKCKNSDAEQQDRNKKLRHLIFPD